MGIRSVNTLARLGTLGIACILLSSLVGCDSSTGSAPTYTCANPGDHLYKISFMIDDREYDFDKLGIFGYLVEERWGWFGSDFTITYSTYGLDTTCELMFKLPQYNSKTYLWNDRSRDSNAYGCDIMIQEGTSRIRLKSVSGSTNLLVYENPAHEHDSLFATFCGIARDSMGTLHNLSEGHFYEKSTN